MFCRRNAFFLSTPIATRKFTKLSAAAQKLVGQLAAAPPRWLSNTMSKATLKQRKAEKKAAGKKAMKATGKKNAAAMKKAGKGIFAPKLLSNELAAICGGKKMARTEVTKKIWAYIKAHKLNAGRVISPDSKLKSIFPVAKIDMLKMPGYISKHLS